MTQPAGQGATVDIASATARQSTSRPRDQGRKAAGRREGLYQGPPPQLDWRKINIGDIGYRLVTENQKQYLGRAGGRVADGDQAAAGSTSTSG